MATFIPFVMLHNLSFIIIQLYHSTSQYYLVSSETLNILIKQCHLAGNQDYRYIHYVNNVGVINSSPSSQSHAEHTTNNILLCPGPAPSRTGMPTSQKQLRQTLLTPCRLVALGHMSSTSSETRSCLFVVLVPADLP